MNIPVLAGGRIFLNDDIGRKVDRADYADCQRGLQERCRCVSNGSFQGISQGRTDDGNGKISFVPIPIGSPGRRNTYPAEDVTIVEIMANPMLGIV